MFGKLPQMHVWKVSKAVGHLVASSRVVDNTSYHSTIKTTPFEALYGYKTPQLGYGPFINVKTEGVGTWVRIIKQCCNNSNNFYSKLNKG